MSSNATPNAYIKSDFTYGNISKRINNIKSETTIKSSGLHSSTTIGIRRYFPLCQKLFEHVIFFHIICYLTGNSILIS